MADIAAGQKTIQESQHGILGGTDWAQYNKGQQEIAEGRQDFAEARQDRADGRQHLEQGFQDQMWRFDRDDPNGGLRWYPDFTGCGIRPL
jgi:hypothetical protein